MGSPSVEAAKTAIQQMNGQVGLFISLSLAICGGLLALIVQVLLHNHSDGKSHIRLRHPIFLVSAFALQVISAILGLACMGAITDAVPAIIGANFANRPLSDTCFEGSRQIGLTGTGQVILFMLSLLCLTVFILWNWRLMTAVGGRER